MSNGVRLPVYDVAKIVRLRGELVRAGVAMCDRVMEGENFEHLLERTSSVLPSQIPPATLRGSLLPMVGTRLSKKDWSLTAWRLAGNLHLLRAGQVVLPWRGQGADEWCPVQIESVTNRHIKKSDSAGAEIVFRVLAGSPAGLTCQRLWSRRFMRMIRTDMGFDRKSEPPEWVIRRDKRVLKGFNFLDPREFTRLRLWGLFTSEHVRNGEPGFFEIYNSSTFKSGWNRDILVLRTKLDTPCPEGYTHDCYLCPVGYLKCPAACHKTTYELKACVGCHKESWHDPANGPGAVCLACIGKRNH
jgi:hypothetical protein